MWVLMMIYDYELVDDNCVDLIYEKDWLLVLLLFEMVVLLYLWMFGVIDKDYYLGNVIVEGLWGVCES